MTNTPEGVKNLLAITLLIIVVGVVVTLAAAGLSGNSAQAETPRKAKIVEMFATKEHSVRRGNRRIYSRREFVACAIDSAGTEWNIELTPREYAFYAVGDTITLH